MAEVADKPELRQFRLISGTNASHRSRGIFMPLPDTGFYTSYFDIHHVSWDGYIKVRRKPLQRARKPVWSASLVGIYLDE